METRIRYKLEANVLVSNKTFDLNGRKVQVSIDLNSNTFKVYDATTAEVLVSGSDKNPAYVKKAAKAAFAKLGYVFGNENRNRGSKDAPASSQTTTAA
jgi:hypothetical protein